jgi:hypothetical protein
LLGKWLARLLTEDGVWQRLLRRKYVGSNAISHIIWKSGDSHFWAGIMTIKKHFFQYEYFSIKDGSEIRFWEDKWLGSTTLREQYPTLYNIVPHKGDTLAKVMETSPPTVSFRRDIIGPWLASWNELLIRLASVHLIQGVVLQWSTSTRISPLPLSPCWTLTESLLRASGPNWGRPHRHFRSRMAKGRRQTS